MMHTTFSIPLKAKSIPAIVSVIALALAAALIVVAAYWRDARKESLRPSEQFKYVEPQAVDEVLMVSKRRVLSTDSNKYPYGLEIVIETNRLIQPVAFIVAMDGEVGIGRAVLFSGGAYRRYARIKQGIPSGHPNWFAFEWETPAFTREAPIVVTLSSAKPIDVTGVYRTGYEWP